VVVETVGHCSDTWDPMLLFPPSAVRETPGKQTTKMTGRRNIPV